jgi:hypothetical protein
MVASAVVAAPADNERTTAANVMSVPPILRVLAAQLICGRTLAARARGCESVEGLDSEGISLNAASAAATDPEPAVELGVLLLFEQFRGALVVHQTALNVGRARLTMANGRSDLARLRWRSNLFLGGKDVRTEQQRCGKPGCTEERCNRHGPTWKRRQKKTQLERNIAENPAKAN